MAWLDIAGDAPSVTKRAPVNFLDDDDGGADGERGEGAEEGRADEREAGGDDERDEGRAAPMPAPAASTSVDAGAEAAPDIIFLDPPYALVVEDPVKCLCRARKLVQRLAGAAAYGPILQGLARQANDLSRGCSSDDVVEVATIACALAGARRESGDIRHPRVLRDASPLHDDSVAQG